MKVPAAAIVADNYRQTFDAGELAALADTIREHGILMPPTVQRVADGRFLLIDGERRLRAMRDVLGWDEIPVTIREDALDGHAYRLAQLAANLQRHDTDPATDGDAFLALQADGLNVEEIAAKLGKGPRWVSDRIAAAQCSPVVREAIAQGRVGIRLAVRLSNLDPNRQRLALAAVLDGKLSPADLTARLDKLAADQSAEDNAQGGFALLIEEWSEEATEEREARRVAAPALPLGREEIAAMLGVRIQTVGQWRTRGILPPEDGTISGSPIWHRATIEEWAQATGRM